MSFDDVFEAVDANGPYQIVVFMFMMFSKAMAGIQMTLPVLIAVHRSYLCLIDSNGNMTTTKHPYLCPMNDTSYSNSTCASLYLDNSTMTSTIQDQYGLFCSYGALVHVSSSIFYLGILIGAIIAGYISDIFGRRPSFMICIGLMVVSSLLCAISPFFVLFVFLRFLVGVGAGGNLTILFTITTEFTVTRTRVYYAFNVHQGVSIGCLLLAALGYLIRNHRDLQLAVAVLPLPLYLSMIFVDESPRWLYSHGKLKEAEHIMRKISRRNGVKFDDAQRRLTNLPTLLPERKKSDNVKTFSIIFRSSNLRRRLFLGGLGWLISNMAYFGQHLGIDSLIEGNIYVKLAISAAVEIPARIAALIIAQHYGRRPALLVSFIGIIVFCSASAIFGTFEKLITAQLVASMIAKFFSTMNLDSFWLFIAELFPTNVRNSSVGLTSVLSRFGAFLGPLVLITHSYMDNMPFIILSGTALCGCLFIFFLPETSNTALTEKWGMKESEVLPTKERACLERVENLEGDNEVTC